MITSIYIFLFCSWAATFNFIHNVLSNSNTEWENMSVVSFQDSFNQVITGKKHLNNFYGVICYVNLQGYDVTNQLQI